MDLSHISLGHVYCAKVARNYPDILESTKAGVSELYCILMFKPPLSAMLTFLVFLMNDFVYFSGALILSP